MRQGVEVPARCPAEHRHQGRLRKLGHLAHGGDSHVPELPPGHLPDAPQPLDRKRMEEGELAVRRHDQQAVGLGHATRDLCEELRPRHADGDRQADLLADLPAQ